MRIRLFGSISVALVLAIALVLTGCGGGGGGQGGGGGGGGEQITVASDISYPPMEFTKNGKPVGFDIDLMNEIAKRANLQAEYQNVTFDGIIPGLGNNLYDAGLSSFTITKAREEKVDFSDPYFNADQSLMVQSDSPIKSVDDIGDGTVGVQLGTTGELKDSPDRRAVRYSLPPGQRSPRAHQQGARGDKEGRHLRRALREVARRETEQDTVG
jgi:ABC-type amino acid transport substrate-binding protein